MVAVKKLNKKLKNNKNWPAGPKLVPLNEANNITLIVTWRNYLIKIAKIIDLTLIET